MKRLMISSLKLPPSRTLGICVVLVCITLNGVAQKLTPSKPKSNSELMDSIHLANWNRQTDSIIRLNRVDFTNFTRLGGMINGKEGVLSFNTFLMLSKYRTYDFGIGTGLEYYNRGTIIRVMQIPFYLSNHLYMGRKMYLLFEPGMIVPVGGDYKSDIEDPNSAIETTVKYQNNDFKQAFYYNIGLGWYTESKVCLELFMRNQSNGILYPMNERITMFGFNLGVKL